MSQLLEEASGMVVLLYVCDSGIKPSNSKYSMSQPLHNYVPATPLVSMF